MNSVFSAFKTSKTDKQKSLLGAKKFCNTTENSYENLRHIREIGSGSKMMTSLVNDDVEDELLYIRNGPIIKPAMLNENDCFTTTDVGDHLSSTLDSYVDANQSEIDSVKSPEHSYSSTSSKNCDKTLSPKRSSVTHGPITPTLSESNMPSPSNSEISRCSSSCSNNSSTSCDVTTIAAHTCISAVSSSSCSSTSSCSNGQLDVGSAAKIASSILSNGHTQPIIMSKLRGNSSTSSNPQLPTACSSATTTPKNVRYSKPRLSISNLNNSSMPSVHGRTAITTSNGTQPRTRLSTHQRNLSLDFRSMGILLPPVSQVTNTRINVTQHHRNRSLDSALQRIPEVEVSSPNAEVENTFCTNSILGATMCAKITSSTTGNTQNTAKGPNTNPVIDSCSRPQLNTSITDNTRSVAKASDNKKREDLTSLGSDDSGIICGSESDQVSLSRSRQSHESLDSGEMDPEEECIEILETTSMDEEYRMLQSDLCFYQTPETDLRTIKVRRKTFDHIENDDVNTDNLAEHNRCGDKSNRSSSIFMENKKICVPIEIDNISVKNSNADVSSDVTPTPTEENKTIETTNKKESETKSEHIKNEILFKNFFGATKNAIFRTAQSIIENHEKKNSAKHKNDDSDVKSPTEISKKKDFFVLKSSSNKAKLGISTTPETPTLDGDVKLLPKSSSGNSLNKLKVPGVVKCFVKEKEQPTQTKTEKGPSSLLRFFESPVFNIHFAVHYLFYSKEPGVLSFIANKIFSFPDQEVDLYIPQLIVMYIQMDELAEVLDPYLTYRCRKSVDFSLKCLWLLEAYNYQIGTLSPTSNPNKQIHLSLMKELYSKRERRQLKTGETNEIFSPIKKTHHRSQSDATVLLSESKRFPSSGALSLSAKMYPPTPSKLCLGDLTSGKAFDNGCTCFESVRGTVNDLLGHKTVCCCGAPKMAPQKEFMKALINIGKNLTPLQSKAEKTSALRMFLNLINKNLPARVWLPLHSNIPHHIVRITEEKTAVLNSKDKTPYIIYVEVVEVNDIYSSPVIIKMMPSLRHTKSEEHLESKDNCSSTKHSSKDTVSDGKIMKNSESSLASENGNKGDQNDFHFTEDDVWSQEDDEITAQYLNLHRMCERDALSQMSLDSCDSRDQGLPTLFNIGDVRTRHCNNLNCENTKPFSNDPEDPSAAALKEPWHEKEQQIRESSPYGHLSNWRLLSAIVKCGDDLRQELMATQLLQMFQIIWEEEIVELWVRPYKIICLSNDSGLIEPILNTVSLHQIKKNSNKSLRDYFIDEYGDPEGREFKSAQKNFVQSCAAYCLISYLLQVKDRHNGNILLHSDGHLIHIDFGFILSISPKNLGFEQSPFKLTPEFVEVMGGTSSELWTEFNHLLLKGLMAARKHMDRIINLVEIMRSNAQLPCFKNGCSGTVQNLRKRFHMNLTEQELERKVEQLVQDSLKSLSTKLYDGYQYFTNGIL